MPDDIDYVVPNHVGIIMDGNGRWAKSKGKPRTFGHKSGADSFKRSVDACIELKVPFVTFYAFSTENWKRPKSEIKALFELFNIYLDDFTGMYKKNARLVFIGDFSVLDKKITDKMSRTMELTKDNTGTTVVIAINYGGRGEIVNAVKKMLDSGVLPDKVNEETLAKNLYYDGLPDVDLLIRTGGDRRISNFLIWQSAYAELVFTDILWPDFEKNDLIMAFRQYSLRDRRFGGL